MKFLVKLFCVTFLAIAPVFAQTYIEGAFAGVLRAEDSPVYVTGNVIVEPSTEMRVESGVTFFFEGPYSIEVRAGAHFAAFGNVRDSIIFAPSFPDVGFLGLRFDNVSVECTLSHCVFEGGIARGFFPEGCGGALHIVSSRVFAKNCIFRGNSAPEGGSGAIVALDNSRLRLEKTVFVDNYALWGGGAVGCSQRCTLFIADCDFRENSTVQHGGAICVDMFSRAQIDASRFSHNFSDSVGGAVGLGNSSFMRIENTILDWNNAVTGGAIYIYGTSHLDLVNSTIAHNASSITGGALGMIDGSEFVALNDIFYENSSPRAAEVFIAYGSPPCDAAFAHTFIDTIQIVSESTIDSVFFAPSVLNLSPSFIDDNYRIGTASSSMDFGSAIFVVFGDTLFAPTHDFDGNVRPRNVSWDIGAYEIQSNINVLLNPNFLSYPRVSTDSTMVEFCQVYNLTSVNIILTSLFTTSSVFDFEISAPYILAPFETLSVAVRFAPDSSKVYVDTAYIIANFDTLVLFLYGEGGNPPQINAVENIIDYGRAKVGGIYPHFVRVENNGGFSYKIPYFDATGDEFTAFISDSTIAPLSHENINVILRPTTRGTLTETLFVNAYDYIDTVFLVAEIYTGAIFSVSEREIFWHYVPINMDVRYDLLIRNIGDSTLVIDDYAVFGEHFTVDGGRLIIEAFDSIEIPVNFFSDEVGNFDATLAFARGTAREESVLIHVQAIAPPALHFADYMLIFGAVNIGETFTRETYLHNSGSLPLLVDDIFVTNPSYNLLTTPFSVIEGGDSQLVQVEFMPEFARVEPGSLAVVLETETQFLFIIGQGLPISVVCESIKPQKNSIDIYPNPFNSSCNIIVPPNSELTVFDLNGKIILRHDNFGKPDAIVHFEPSAEISSAVFLAKIVSGSRIFVQKIVLLR